MFAPLKNSAVAGTITGVSGNLYNVSQLQFDYDTYDFAYGESEVIVSNDITRADKLLLVPDFDIDQENYRLHNVKRTGTGTPGSIQPLETSTTKIFLDQITTEPLKAPLESLTNTVNEVLGNNGVKKLLFLGLLGVGIYLAVKHADK